MEPFIAPEGAMQYVFSEVPDEAIWVLPGMIKLDRNIHCSCTEGMTVVKGFDDDSDFEFTTPPHMSPTVCLCQGHLIE